MQYDIDLLNENLNEKVSLRDFFHAFGYKDKDEIYFRIFSDRAENESEYKHKKNVTLRSIDSIIPTLKKENAVNRGVGFIVNGGGQDDKSVKIARACFMENDDLSFEDQLKKICEFPLEPSIIIKTGKSLHTYWLTPNGEINYFRELQERLIAYFKSDPDIRNESRPMRLYGFNHCKGDPVEVKLIKFSPELTYTQRQLHDVLPKLEKKIVTSTQREKKSPAELIPCGQRHKYVVSQAATLVNQLGDRYPAEDILDLLVSDYKRNCAQDPTFDEQRFKNVYLKTIQKFMANGNHRELSQKAGKRWNELHPGEKIENWNEVIVEYLKSTEISPEDEQRIEKGYQEKKAADSKKSLNLADFHHFNGKQATSVYDYMIYEDISRDGELFIMGSVPYYYNHGVFMADMSSAHLKTEISRHIYPQLIKSSTIDRVYKLFLGREEIQATNEDINKYPKHWINFLNGFYDPIGCNMIPHDPKYKAINQIPHEYHPGAKSVGEEVENWLKFIVPCPDDREMLLQYIGYSMTSDTRFQKMLILRGVGGSGKSTLISIMERIIGTENISHVSLKELSNRFFSYGLVGKLLNSCADLEISALEDTSVIKKLLGEDSMMVEAKGKDPISYKNHAKLIFSTNELPLVLSEKTNGFYRRLLILNMNNQPEKSRADFLDVLSNEVDYLIMLSVDALRRAYQNGKITESEESAKSVQTLWNDSDTVEAWLDECCERNQDSKEERGFLYQKYNQYCEVTERQSLTKNGFFKALRTKGFEESKSNGQRVFKGISYGKSALNSPEKLPCGSNVVSDTETIPFKQMEIVSA